jgi:hypothetical protein
MFLNLLLIIKYSLSTFLYGLQTLWSTDIAIVSGKELDEMIQKQAIMRELIDAG